MDFDVGRHTLERLNWPMTMSASDSLTLAVCLRQVASPSLQVLFNHAFNHASRRRRIEQK